MGIIASRNRNVKRACLSTNCETLNNQGEGARMGRALREPPALKPQGPRDFGRRISSGKYISESR